MRGAAGPSWLPPILILGFALLFSPDTLADGLSLAPGQGWHYLAFALPLGMLAFTGLETRQGKLWLDPCLPDDLRTLAFRLHYREHHGIEVDVTHDRLVIGGRRRIPTPLMLRVRDRDYKVDPGATRMVPLHRVQSIGGP